MSAERIRSSILAYAAAWNEPDAEKRAELIGQACSDAVRIVAPGQELRGRAALDAAIVDFQRGRPGDRARLTSAIEVQHHAFRFVGRVDGSSGAPAIEMLDAGECDEDGRIRLILTFVGAAPAREEPGS